MNILGRSEYNIKNPLSLSGIEYHRQYAPFEYLRECNKVDFRFASNLINNPDIDLSQFHLYHLVRKDVKVIDGNWTDAGSIKIAKDAGLPVIIDFDDLWRLDSTHALYDYYRTNKVEQLSIKWMEQADHVTTTTERLASHIRKINPNVTIIPNAILPVTQQFAWSEPDKSERELPNIGWLGSIHHLNDIALISKFFDKYWSGTIHKQANLVMAGYDRNQAVYQKIANIMAGQSNHGLQQLRCLETMPSTHYGRMYQHIDIALAPLADNEFNRCKSELKLIEAGHFGIPVIASDVYPYNTVIEHGVNGFLIKNTKNCYKQWLKYSLELIHDPVYRYHMGQALKETIRSRFNMSTSNAIRHKLYSELCRK